MGGALTSLGPCSLSLLPITLAYLAGFEDGRQPWQRSLAFCGRRWSASPARESQRVAGTDYGQVPAFIPTLVAIVAVVMGLNLLGLLRLPLPNGHDPEAWRKRVSCISGSIAAGLAWPGRLPRTTPVLAVLLAWIAQSGRPLVGMALLTSFGIGQVLPLLLAGTFAATVPSLLALRPIGRWVPPISGVILLSSGLLTMLARWT